MNPNSKETQQKKNLKQKTKRGIFKHVVQSPFDYQWPDVPLEKHDVIFAELIRLLKPFGEERKRKRQERNPKFRAQQNKETNHDGERLGKLKQSIRIGVNAITKQLGRELAHTTQNASPSDQPSSSTSTVISKQEWIVFVCTSDATTRHLYMHLPALAHFHGNIRLYPLPLGAESVLSETLCIPHPLVVGIQSTCDVFSSSLVPKVVDVLPEYVQIPWMQGEYQPLKTVEQDVSRKKALKRKRTDSTAK